MLDDEEWDWVHEHATGGFDHLLVATSLPWLLGRGMHYLEAWSEAVAGGAWGSAAAGAAENLRQAADMEHWAAFQESFARLSGAVQGGRHGRARRAAGVDRDALRRRAPRLPVRGRLPARNRDEERTSGRPSARPTATRSRSASARASGSACRGPSRSRCAASPSSPGSRDPGIGWRMVGDGPWFDNQVATLTVDGRRIEMRLDKAVPVDETTRGSSACWSTGWRSSGPNAALRDVLPLPRR